MASQVLKLVFLVLLVQYISSEVVTIVVDDFSVSTGGNLIINIGEECVSGHTAAELTQSKITQNATILGGERDLYITALDGCSGVLQSNVASGNYSATTDTLTGVGVLQYDGDENPNSLEINATGLGGLNLKVSGGYGFKLPNASTDQPTYLIFRVYSVNVNDYCQFNQSLLPGFQTVAINFTQFTNVGAGCDFGNVGAIVISTALINASDVVYREINVVGPTPVTATASVSLSPAISATPSPSRVAASASATPSTSGCLCTCPKFECYMFKFSSTSFYGYVDQPAKRDVNEDLQVREEDEGFFSFLKFF